MYILGISAFYHDSAACLLKDGKIVAAAQEERFTRKKHDQDFPQNAISYCLKSEGITVEDLEYVSFYEKPFLKFERILESYFAYAPLGIRSFLKALPIWMKKKLWIKEIIQKELNYKGKIIFPEHHESHAASAFFPSPFQEAAFLTIDAVGEWSTTSFGVGKDNQIKIVADVSFPHSLGLLYSAFTYYLGFKVNSGEYKVMGLAPYGEPKYKDLILKELVDLKEDGSFKLNMGYFNYVTGLTMTNKSFEKLFGFKRRLPETELKQEHMDIARSIQAVTEEIVLRMARHVKNKTNQQNLCLAGGVALNCVANGKILQQKVFENIWIQPASGDAGGAVGSALAVWYQYLKNKRVADGVNDSMSGAYLGPAYSNDEIESYLKENNISFNKIQKSDIPNKVSSLINDGKVIGFFQGRMEFGPRALGGRSILGDARSPEMQKKINLKIKLREEFRPFAPSVLLEEVSNYFNMAVPSPYMLLVADIKEEFRKENNQDSKRGLDKLSEVRSVVPAITHIDYSARIQSVDGKYNAPYYSVIKNFNDKYGCPIIVNTSFNVRGEPIVCTPEDAFNCFMNTDMDYLVIEDFVLDKTEQDKERFKKNKSGFNLD